jgi:hypothetical protein
VNPFALHLSALHLFATRTVATSCTGECQKSGPLGLLVILLLCVACYFLFKSLSRHLRNVRDHFPAELPPDPSAAKRPVATTVPAVAAGGGAHAIEAAVPADTDPAQAAEVEVAQVGAAQVEDLQADSPEVHGAQAEGAHVELP